MYKVILCNATVTLKAVKYITELNFDLNICKIKHFNVSYAHRCSSI